MFGKPNWFRKRKKSWGLVPISFQGWAYALAWVAVLAIPFTALVLRHQAIEAMIWLVAAGGLLMYDVRHIMVAMQQPSVADAEADDVLYIGDDDAGQNHRLATRNFNFQLRR